MSTAAAPAADTAAPEAPESGETQVRVPKASLPDCQVGEKLSIVAEDGEDFVISPDYSEQGAGEGGGEAEGDTPAAVKAIMGQ